MQLEGLSQGGVSNLAEREKLEDWMQTPGECVGLHELRVKSFPVPQLEDRLMVLFGCEAMERHIEYYHDIDMAISVDCKQGAIHGKESICGINLLSKSGLRTTAFGTVDNKRCQGRAYCTHGEPVLNGVFDVEGEEHFSQLFRATKRIIDARSPGKPPAEQRILQVHKDYAAGIEGCLIRGRGTIFPISCGIWVLVALERRNYPAGLR